MAKPIFTARILGSQYDRSLSDGEIIEYPETKLIHRTTKWDEGTIILGELTSGQGGTVAYNFHIPRHVVSDVKYAELRIDTKPKKIWFHGKLRSAVASINVNDECTLFFPQDSPSDRPSSELGGGYISYKSYPKPDKAPIQYFYKRSCIKLHKDLLKEELRMEISVMDLQQIVIKSLDLRVY